MPTYRSISLALHSQFDIETLPEYLPQPQEYYTERGTVGKVPPLLDEKTSTCSVYIPVLPGSQFWISYSVLPPVPDGQHFLFKLFINGTHIVSWSAGKEEAWKGKTMFGLYERKDEDGQKQIEKRVLCFTPPDKKEGRWTDVTDAFDENAYLEIRVHRARGRRRMERKVEEYKKTDHGKSRRGIDLVNAGRAGSEQPKRFYKFALIDPIDQPFATFRYYYRTWEQIQELDLLEEDIFASGDVTEMSVIEPYDTEDARSQQTDDGKPVTERVLEDVFQTSHDGAGEHTAVHHGVGAQRDASSSDLRKVGRHSDDDEHAQPRRSAITTPPQFYRLSVPPSCRLSPPKGSSRPLPSIPQKSNRSPDTSYRPHPAYPVEDWVVRTPSPIKSIRDGISTPPLGKRRAFTPTAIMCAIATTWRRRGTPNSQCSNDTTGGTSSRSVSG